MAAGSTLIVNSDVFVDRNLTKAGYETNPLTDGSLNGFTLYEVPMTSLTIEAAKPSGAKTREAERAKNFFALGLLSWMYSRPGELTLDWIEQRFAKTPAVAEANALAFKAGYNFGETAELVGGPFEVKATHFNPGTYTNISGNTALAWGLIAAGQLAELPLFLASYPITPASDILHELSKRQNFGVRTMQAEDEIAAAGAALGASFGGHLGVTTTSGPGMDLKAETVGLAVSLELPLLIIDVQRGGPSTGLPTKTEQSDLLMAMHGRHGEAPVPVIAAKTPGHCFYAAIEAARIALKYRTPVILLSDGYLANSAEPWRLPDVAELPDIRVSYATRPNGTAADGTPEFLPYLRDPETLARPWAVPGTPGLEHRVGGLEKADRTGVISYDATNHELMVRTRDAKVAGIAADIPPVELDEPEGGGDVLVLGWGSTYGSIVAAVERLRRRGLRVARAHLVHLNPFPADLGEVLARYPKVLIPEMNLGQLTSMIRAKFLVDARAITKIQGQRFLFSEIEAAVLALMEV
jgi:2-oxoglutarate ferredoxin oxidoreductase subunit alpha